MPATRKSDCPSRDRTIGHSAINIDNRIFGSLIYKSIMDACETLTKKIIIHQKIHAILQRISVRRELKT